MIRTCCSALVVSLLVASALSGQGGVPCFERSLGTDLVLGDDEVSQGHALGFGFPFGGGTVTSIDVSSNGFVWLASDTGTGCCEGDVASFLAGSARIAALWTDLDPGSSGSVHFATFPGRAVVTWSRVVEYGGSLPLTAQIQLLANGSIVLFWAFEVAVNDHATLVGVTPGNGTTDPGSTPLRSVLRFDSGSSATVYQHSPAGATDVGGMMLLFRPNGRGGYDVARRNECVTASFSRFGAGCPIEPSVYELFGAGGIDLSGLAFDFTPTPSGAYSVTACTSACLDPAYVSATDLGIVDDSVAHGVQLGFRFPFAGGTTTAVDVSSNGSVYLLPGSIAGSRASGGNPARFLSEAASIAVLWLDMNVSDRGSVRVHRPDPSTFVVTYANVAERGATGTANTAQLQLFADGRFRLAYGAVANRSQPCLVGFTPGFGAVDPGSVDLSTSTPFTTSPGPAPLTLAAAAGIRPVIGAAFPMIVGEAPVGSTAGLLLYGFASNGAVSLAPAGMPGCALYLRVDAVRSFAVQGRYSQVFESVPGDPSLNGIVLYVQAAILAPGVNPLGVVVSNGGRIQLGV